MKRILTVIIILSTSISICLSQKKVLEKTVDDEVFNSNEGPNKKSFKHFYIQYSMFPVDYKGAEINLLKSNVYGVGYRYKYKLSSFYSLGVDANYLLYSFNLKQNNEKQLPNTIQHKNEILRTNSLSLEIYQRVNIGKAGNMLGLYFDLGGYAGYTFSPRHIYKDKVTDVVYNSKISITKRRGLDYFEPISYGLRAKLGYNKLGVVTEYRLSNILKNKYNYPKLPDWSVGLQLSLF